MKVARPKWLKGRAVARRSDPQTSWYAASSVGDTSDKQHAVLRVFDEIGACTDEMLVTWYRALAPVLNLPPQAESGMRTRRVELVRAGHVERTDRKMPTKTGRLAIVWQKVPPTA